MTADMLSYKRSKCQEQDKAKKSPWRKRIRMNPAKSRKVVGQTDRLKRGEITKSKNLEKLDREYCVTEKRTETVLEELRQNVIAIGAKLKRYDD